MSPSRIIKLFALITVLLVIVVYVSWQPPGQPEQPRRQVELVALPLHRPEKADRASLSGVVQASNAFAVDLYHTLRSEPGNILVSPTCLTAALRILRAGARGATAAEFDRVLHWPGGASEFPLAALIQDLNADGEERCFQIRQASAVWVQQGHALLDDYRATLCDVFGVNDDRLVFSPQSASFWRP